MEGELSVSTRGSTKHLVCERENINEDFLEGVGCGCPDDGIGVEQFEQRSVGQRRRRAGWSRWQQPIHGRPSLGPPRKSFVAPRWATRTRPLRAVGRLRALRAVGLRLPVLRIRGLRLQLVRGAVRDVHGRTGRAILQHVRERLRRRVSYLWWRRVRLRPQPLGPRPWSPRALWTREGRSRHGLQGRRRTPALICLAT